MMQKATFTVTKMDVPGEATVKKTMMATEKKADPTLLNNSDLIYIYENKRNKCHNKFVYFKSINK